MPINKIFIDEKSRRTEYTALNRILIGSVHGLMTSKFSVSLQASWETLISTDGLLGDVQKVLTVGGKSIFNTGAWTRKFFKGGTYLTVSPSFRIVDWDGTGIVILSAKKLLSKTVPQKHGSAEAKVSDVQKDMIDQAKLSKTNSLIENKGHNRTVGGNLDALKNSIGRLVQSKSFSSAPNTTRVTISNYFHRAEMIIESVNVEFSEEIGPKGPLYGDFSVTLSSVEAATSTELGLICVTNPTVIIK